MEALGNSSFIAIPCFSIIVAINTDFKLMPIHLLIHNFGLFFSFVSVLFKLYLFKLSYSDYFEFEQYQYNKSLPDLKKNN